MLQPTMPTTQVQYVVGREDLEAVISSIVDERIAKFFDTKRKEAEGDTLITPKEVCQLLGVNLTTLWRWNNEGYLTKVYIGNKPRYRQSDIDRILKKGSEK